MSFPLFFLPRLLPALHPDRSATQEQIHPPPGLRTALAREWRRLLRRPADLALASWLPLLAMLLLGVLVAALPPSAQTVAVLDLDQSAASRDLLRRLEAGPELRLMRLPLPSAAPASASPAPGRHDLLDAAEGSASAAPPFEGDRRATARRLAAEAVTTGRAQAALLVPVGFGAELAAGARALALGGSAAGGTVLPHARIDLELAAHSDAADARILITLQQVLASLAAQADLQAGQQVHAQARLPGRAGQPAPATGQATASDGPVAASPLRLHVDAPALQARADAQVAGCTMLLLLLHLCAALLTASVIGREFTERSAAQWLAASGRRWRVALAAKLALPLLSMGLLAVLGLALWQTLAPWPLQGAWWLVGCGLLLAQWTGVGLGLLFCALWPSLRATLSLFALLTPLVLVLLQHASAGSSRWAGWLPVAQVLRLVDHAWWQPATLGWNGPALRGLAILALQAALALGLGGWLLSRRAFLPGLMQRA